MQVIEDKALLITTKYPERILTTIEKSADLGEIEGTQSHRVLVRWGLEEAVRLAQLRVKNVPSPIVAKYRWPGQYKPFAHQITTASFLTLHQKCFCLNEQGTGKTSAAIWAADYLMEKGLVHRVLVVCPLSIMESAWIADIFRTAMHRAAAVAYGSRDKRKEIVSSTDWDFVVVNYDGLEIVQPEILDNDYDLIIVDEANAYKNPSTRRWKVLDAILQAKPACRLWMMTGTPAAQSPVDAYGLAKLVNPSGVPKFYGSWRDMVMQKFGQFRWVPRAQSEDTVFRALQPAIRFTKEECLDLPDLVSVMRDVPLTKQQERYYKLLKKKMTITAADEQITAINAAVAVTKLLQISAGAVYSDQRETVEFDMSTRLAVLEEVIEESSHKVLVFVPFRHCIDILQDFLAKKGVTTEVIHGDITAPKRTATFSRFQEQRDPKVLIVQPQSAAHGVTLTRADTVVFWSPVMSVETYLQCIARAHRQGQKNKTTVVHLQGSDTERRIYKMLVDKIDVHSRLVELYAQEVETTTKE